LIDAIYTILTSPRVTTARHYLTTLGQEERAFVLQKQGDLDDSIVLQFHEISSFGEKLKEAGMPAGEKTRLSAFEQGLYSAYLNLRSIKDYRTPGGLR
jgi:hypothetical protein